MKTIKAQVTLTVSESKRLIAKAAVEHDKVKNALKSGIIALPHGSTNAYIVEEILNKKIAKEKYVAGVIIESGACVVPKEKRISSFVFEKGKAINESVEEVVKRMGADDVFIKGANLIDVYGNAGVMLGSEVGGTIGRTLGTILARGINLIIPVGLEKLVPGDVFEIAKRTGINKVDLSLDLPFGIMPLCGEVITEIEALKILGGEDSEDIEVIVSGSGGVSGGEGAKCFLIEGKDESVEKLFGIIKSLKGEKNITGLKRSCKSCIYRHCPNNIGR